MNIVAHIVSLNLSAFTRCQIQHLIPVRIARKENQSESILLLLVCTLREMVFTSRTIKRRKDPLPAVREIVNVRNKEKSKSFTVCFI